MVPLHEWAVADAIVSSLVSFCSSKGASRILEVEIVYGEAMEYDLDVLRDAVEYLSKGTPLEGAKIVFREEKSIFRCNACGAEWDMAEAERLINRALKVEEEGEGFESPLHFIPELASSLMRCPRCGSPDVEMVKGDSVRVSKVVMS